MERPGPVRSPERELKTKPSAVTAWARKPQQPNRHHQHRSSPRLLRSPKEALLFLQCLIFSQKKSRPIGTGRHGSSSGKQAPSCPILPVKLSQTTPSSRCSRQPTSRQALAHLWHLRLRPTSSAWGAQTLITLHPRRWLKDFRLCKMKASVL